MRSGLAAAALLIATAAACHRGGDADRIVFQSDRNGSWAAYSVRPDGSDLTRIAELGTGLALWSPEGGRLFVPVETMKGGKAFVVDTRTGARSLVRVHAVGGATWSPDGSRIAVAAERGIVVLDADGSNRLQLTFDPTDSEPTWSPDGERIAFVSGRDLYTVEPDGGIRHVLGAGDDVFAPRWSSDGGWLAFGRFDADASAAALVVVRADGTGRRQVAGDGEQVVWSPAAPTLLYVHAGDVFRVDADGRRRARLTFGGPDYSLSRSPSWSPDGKRIAYVEPRLARRIRTPLTRTDIWVMNADGSGKRPVTRAFPTGGLYDVPGWVERAPAGTPVRSPSHLVELRPRHVLRTRQPVGGLSAEGSTAVVVQGLGSGTEVDNPPGPLLLWDAGSSTTRRTPVRGCGTATTPMRIGRRVAYVCNNSAVDVYDWEVRVGTRTLVHLRATHLVGAPFVSRLLQGVAAGDTMLAFGIGERPRLTTGGFSARRTTVWRLDGTRLRKIAAFPREARVVDADARRVAVVHEGSVVTLDARTGRVVQRLAFQPNDVRDLVLDGARIVALLRERLAVYDAAGGRLRAQRRLPPDLGRPRHLAGVQGDVVAYVAGLAIHVVRLSDGRELVVDLRTAAEPVLARLTPAGLFYSYTDPRGLPAGRVAFVARTELDRALARAD